MTEWDSSKRARFVMTYRDVAQLVPSIADLYFELRPCWLTKSAISTIAPAATQCYGRWVSMSLLRAWMATIIGEGL